MAGVNVCGRVSGYGIGLQGYVAGVATCGRI